MTTAFNFSGTALAGLPGVLGGGADVGASAGVSGGLAGLFSGLVESSGTSASGGFFANLTAQAATATPAVPDLATLVASVQVAGDAQVANGPLAALQALLQQAGVEVSTTLPNDGVKIEGAQNAQADETLKILAEALQQVQRVAGGTDLTDPAALKAALQKLGVPEEKIESLVSNIQDMLAKLKQKLNLDDTQIAALAPMIVAANVAPLLQNDVGQALVTADKPLTVAIKAAAANAVTPEIEHANDALKQAASYPAAANIAREVAGIQEPAEVKVKDEVQAAADDTAESANVALDVADATLSAVAVTIDAVGATMRDVLKTPTAVTPKMTTNATMQTVAPDSVLGPVQGDVKFTWHGEDTAKPAMVAAKTDSGADKVDVTAGNTADVKPHGEWMAQANATASSAQDADTADFAKQVEQFQQKIDLAKRYDVAGQTVVQMKSLIDQGGGEIRIKLNPPELGQIHVELSIKDGTVSGKISASDPAVVNALANDVKQFGDGLRQSGFKLGNEGLSFMLSQQNPQQQNSQQQQQAQNNTANGFRNDVPVEEEAALMANNPAAWVAPERLLDMSI